MVVGLGGRGTGGNMYVANKGVREEEAGKNCGVCCRDYYILTMYI